MPLIFYYFDDHLVEKIVWNKKDSKKDNFEWIPLNYFVYIATHKTIIEQKLVEKTVLHNSHGTNIFHYDDHLVEKIVRNKKGSDRRKF